MRRDSDDIRRVEDALRDAWSTQPPHDLPPDWSSGVMNEILAGNESPLVDEDRFELQGSLVWRFAAAAAAVAIMFTIYLLRSDLTGFSDLAMMMLQDPAGFVISPPFV